VGVFLDSRAAGRGRVCWEVGMAWIFASRASFGEGAGRFCQCLLGAVYAAANTIRVDAARAEEVVSGLRIWIRRSLEVLWGVRSKKMTVVTEMRHVPNRLVTGRAGCLNLDLLTFT
jgi:hypothetical protein